MQITSYTWKNELMLIQAMRRVKLLSASVYKGYIYKHAQIALEELPIDDIFPAQFYMLNDGIQNADLLQRAFSHRHIDIFHLDGYVDFIADRKEARSLLPPIVEYQKEPCGCLYPILVDGIHRVYLAKQLGVLSIQALCIRDVLEKIPIPMYCNYFKWNNVELVDKIPDVVFKKSWRMPVVNAYAYYRNYDEVFPGIGRPRT